MKDSFFDVCEFVGGDKKSDAIVGINFFHGLRADDVEVDDDIVTAAEPVINSFFFGTIINVANFNVGVFNEYVLLDAFLEFWLGNKKIVFAVFFFATWGARGRGDKPFCFWQETNDFSSDSAFADAGGATDDD